MSTTKLFESKLTKPKEFLSFETELLFQILESFIRTI